MVWANYQNLALILLYAGLAWIGIRVLPPMASRAVLAATQSQRTRPLSSKRIATINRLSRDLTRFVIVLTALIAAVALYVDSRGLFTFLGLFSAAFGLGARPLVSDYMSGAVYLFEDLFAIGDKVEVFGIEGMVEDVRLRTTVLRAPSGELYFIPNGEIRAVRNFARGTFSDANLHLKVPAKNLDEVLALLEETLVTARAEMPQLLERPKLLSVDGAIGDTVDLTVLAKAEYGHGPETRRQLMHRVQHALNQTATHSHHPSDDPHLQPQQASEREPKHGE